MATDAHKERPTRADAVREPVEGACRRAGPPTKSTLARTARGATPFEQS